MDILYIFRHMKRAMDLDNLKDVLQHAANMLYELRTSRLTPRNHYRLYMDVRIFSFSIDRLYYCYNGSLLCGRPTTVK